MSQTVEAIADAAGQFGLTDADLRLLRPDEARALVLDLEREFVEEPGLVWWWEAFRHPSESRAFVDDRGFERLTDIAPDEAGGVWFVVEGDSASDFSAFETSVPIAQRVIGECPAFEYYLVAKDRSWLICENHHCVIYAIGAAAPRLAQLDRALEG